ncbi:MAG: hypothetical protein IJS45_10200 [Clostridia bacterium]|nr:hypothetical protein [Clostridia bacterium]
MKKVLISVSILIFTVLTALSGCTHENTPEPGKDTSAVNKPYEFHSGLAAVCVNESESIWEIIDTNETVLVKFIKDTGKVRFLNNGNIFLSSVSLNLQNPSFDDFGTYMYCINTGELVEMPQPAYNYVSMIDYSDGLMIIYSNYLKGSGIKYFDSDGNCVLDLDNSNENYKEVTWASGFEDNEAVVYFTGTDNNTYRVTIDKEGNWLAEPDQKKSGRRFGDYNLEHDNPFK